MLFDFASITKLDLEMLKVKTGDKTDFDTASKALQEKHARIHIGERVYRQDDKHDRKKD